MDHLNVVIAGGGPVGLWLAAELRRGGISVTVIEERVEIDQHSKALTIHPRTIEVLSSRGIHETFLAEGVRIPSGHFGALDNRLDFSSLETPYPFTLALPQARTEELMEETARDLGATIVRGHRVTGFTEGTDVVTVQVEGPEGVYELQAAYLVGCDGTRSTVRTAANIGFPGTSSTTLGWLGDVVLDNPPRLGFSAFNDQGGILIAPLPGGQHRIVGHSPESFTTEWPGDLTLAELRRNVEAIAGDDFGMHDPSWLSRFGNATRLAAEYRRGRVLLAGDAAHQHLPAGGVGMNVGIQDAHNLGWKLAATLNGWAPDALLDTYQSERRPVGVQLTEHTRAQAALVTAFTPEGLALRTLLSEMIAEVPAFGHMLALRLTGLGVNYPATDPTIHPLTGTRAPNLSFADRDEDLFSLLRTDAYLLLDLTTGSTLSNRVQSGLAVHSGTLDRPPSAWSDVRAALIRPDGHVAWAGTDADNSTLSATLDEALASALVLQRCLP